MLLRPGVFTLACIFSITLAFGTLAFGTPAFGESLSGYWQGEEGVQEVQFQLIEGPDGSLTGRLRGVANGNDLPIVRGQRTGDSVTLELPGIEYRFTGTFDGSEIDGYVERPWAQTDLSLSRAQALAPERRVQDPADPLSYRSETIFFASTDGDINLAGTLTLPEGAGPFPAIVIVSNEGAQDRDGASSGHRPHLVLADALTRRGFAVLRYDDRGVGGSSGLYDSATTQGYAGDAEGALAFLKARSDMDAHRLAVIGRGNGAVIASRAGMNVGVAALVLMSAPATKGADAVQAMAGRTMRQAGSDDDDIAERQRVQGLIFALIVNAPATDSETLRGAIAQIIRDEAGPILGLFVSDGMIDALARRLITPWFRDYLTLDPLSEFRRITVPTLVAYGSADRSNPPDEAMAPVTAAIASTGAVATTMVFPGLSANLATAPDDPEITGYEINETISPAALAMIGDYLTATLMVPQ